MSPLRAVVLDTDGVLIDSAAPHAAAWKSASDGCLDAWAAGTGHAAQPPFDTEREYRELVDGKPRLDGALAFLTARGIELPAGDAADPPGCGTARAVAVRKERAFTEALRAGAVEAFSEVRPALEVLRAHGMGCAAVSASRHARSLLESAAITPLVDVLVEGTRRPHLARGDRQPRTRRPRRRRHRAGGSRPARRTEGDCLLRPKADAAGSTRGCSPTR